MNNTEILQQMLNDLASSIDLYPEEKEEVLFEVDILMQQLVNFRDYISNK